MRSSLPIYDIPQDFSLLNEAREKLEKMIDRFCTDYSLLKPRMYRREARKNYLALAKTKKRSKNKTHSVNNRIFSISQPYLSSIVRGETKSPVEFGAKFDLSVDEKGHGRIEKLSFEAYNDSNFIIYICDESIQDFFTLFFYIVWNLLFFSKYPFMRIV
jgi:hypothetical protein